LAFGPIQGGPHGLAIHTDQLTAGDLMNGLDPTEETVDEVVGVEQGEDPADGVVRGDAVGQSHELLEPGPLGVAKLLHGDEVIGPAEHGTDGEEQDIDESMALAAFDAWILKGGKMVRERCR